jgi:hypothetical protein
VTAAISVNADTSTITDFHTIRYYGASTTFIVISGASTDSNTVSVGHEEWTRAMEALEQRRGFRDWLAMRSGYGACMSAPSQKPAPSLQKIERWRRRCAMGARV